MRTKHIFFPRLVFSRKKFVTLYSKSKHYIAMKKIFYLMLLCATALGITSCSKHEITTNDLIGKWERSEALEDGAKTMHESFTFETNGTCNFNQEVIDNNWEEPKYDNTPDNPDFPEGALDSNVVYSRSTRYTYTLNGDILYLTYKDRDTEPTTTAYIVSIKKNTLTLTNAEEAEKMKPEYVTSTTYTKAN